MARSNVLDIEVSLMMGYEAGGVDVNVCSKFEMP